MFSACLSYLSSCLEGAGGSVLDLTFLHLLNMCQFQVFSEGIVVENTDVREMSLSLLRGLDRRAKRGEGLDRRACLLKAALIQ